MSKKKSSPLGDFGCASLFDTLDADTPLENTTDKESAADSAKAEKASTLQVVQKDGAVKPLTEVVAEDLEAEAEETAIRDDLKAGVLIPTEETTEADAASESVSEDDSDADGEADEELGDEDEAVEASADLSTTGIINAVMGGNVEDEGELTLARYASRAYLEYAMSVVKSRALPVVSDGQKPVQRRILIDMDRMGLKAGSSRVKSARVVGDVLGKYHPHGDQSVYDAMVRMAQEFSLRYPLIEGQGNFGSRDGDSQAAMRYTEARLMPIADLLLEEVDSGAVDFTPNYDGNFQEPVELPAKLPFVLLNGASGIAVGMATEIPSHNLSEVAAACELLIDRPESTLDDVMKVLPAPDFPCGAQIISPRDVIRDIYATGLGKLRVRARYHFEELQRGQWQLVIDELPPEASTAKVLARIEEITNPKITKPKKALSAKQQQAKSAMLSILERVRDESDKSVAVRLVFEPKSSKIDREEFVQALLSQTQMESNVSMNLVMLGNDGKPQRKNLLSILKEWIDFRFKVVRRRSEARLEKVNDRIHVLDGRRIALINLDRVIEIVRNDDDPKNKLMSEFALTERQAEDILEIRLRQLARMAALALERELNELNKERESLERLLSSDAVFRRQVVKEIREAQKQFGDERRTLIQEAEQAVTEQKVVDEPITVVISQKGYLRARTGHGFDCSTMGFKVGDQFERQIECRSVDELIFLTDTGRCYSLKVSALPGARGDGLPISSFFDLDKESKRFAAILPSQDKTDIAIVTTDGYALACELNDLKSSVRNGRQFVRLNEGASVLDVIIKRETDFYFGLLNSNQRVLVFPFSELKVLNRGGLGTIAMRCAFPEVQILSATGLDARGLSVIGQSRNGKDREMLIQKTTFEGFISARARAGKALGVSWKASSIAGLPLEGVDPEGSSSGSALGGSTPSEQSDKVVTTLEEEVPTLL